MGVQLLKKKIHTFQFQIKTTLLQALFLLIGAVSPLSHIYETEFGIATTYLRNEQGIAVPPSLLQSIPPASVNRTFLMYAVFHDETSRKEIEQTMARPWIRPLFVPSTYLFESMGYHLIALRRHEWGEWTFF